MSLNATWMTALRTQAEPAVLVTLARAQGSVPREAGAKMLVTPEQLFDTIGGGHLELRAAEIARAMLAGAHAAPLTHYRFPLGPSLGQCCGGVAELVFEHLPWPRPAWVEELAALLGAGRAADLHTSFKAGAPKTIAASSTGHSVCELRHDGAALTLAERITPCDFRIMLFGAGHVGGALANILAALPCELTWLDSREEQFPQILPGNVRAETDDMLETRASRAFPGTYYLVMTHDHALDQAVSETILRRGDFAWFGLIGSATKRSLFERRLAARGIAQQALDRMTCPIGIAGIGGKEPGVIAVAVAAQLLAARDARLAHARLPPLAAT
jgi:xanthine dehydrogenase accessory factor